MLNFYSIQIKGSGVLTGGFTNREKSLTKLYFTLKRTKVLNKKNMCDVKRIQEEINTVNADVSKNENSLQKIERKIENSNVSSLEEDLKKLRSTLSVLKQAIEGKRTLARKLTVSLKANQAKIETLKNELFQVYSLDFL